MVSLSRFIDIVIQEYEKRGDWGVKTTPSSSVREPLKRPVQDLRVTIKLSTFFHSET